MAVKMIVLVSKAFGDVLDALRLMVVPGVTAAKASDGTSKNAIQTRTKRFIAPSPPTMTRCTTARTTVVQ